MGVIGESLAQPQPPHHGERDDVDTRLPGFAPAVCGPRPIEYLGRRFDQPTIIEERASQRIDPGTEGSTSGGVAALDEDERGRHQPPIHPQKTAEGTTGWLMPLIGFIPDRQHPHRVEQDGWVMADARYDALPGPSVPSRSVHSGSHRSSPDPVRDGRTADPSAWAAPRSQPCLDHHFPAFRQIDRGGRAKDAVLVDVRMVLMARLRSEDVKGSDRIADSGFRIRKTFNQWDLPKFGIQNPWSGIVAVHTPNPQRRERNHDEPPMNSDGNDRTHAPVSLDDFPDISRHRPHRCSSVVPSSGSGPWFLLDLPTRERLPGIDSFTASQVRYRWSHGWCSLSRSKGCGSPVSESSPTTS